MKMNGLSLFCSSISIELLAELLSDVFSARVLIALILLSLFILWQRGRNKPWYRSRWDDDDWL
jgi:hypothetical protein